MHCLCVSCGMLVFFLLGRTLGCSCVSECCVSWNLTDHSTSDQRFMNMVLRFSWAGVTASCLYTQIVLVSVFASWRSWQTSQWRLSQHRLDEVNFEVIIQSSEINEFAVMCTSCAWFLPSDLCGEAVQYQQYECGVNLAVAQQDPSVWATGCNHLIWR